MTKSTEECIAVNGQPVISSYGDVAAEHDALGHAAGVLDLSCRGRLCLGGADAERFLNGQVTNNVKGLKPGEGCYAYLVTAKGKVQADLNIFRLETELLLDFEPGLSASIQQRLERYIIADDVQIADVSTSYGLLSVQGPEAARVVAALAAQVTLPSKPLTSVSLKDWPVGEAYIMNVPRVGGNGFDFYVAQAGAGDVLGRLVEAAQAVGGRQCGWQALELARIEAGIPRFGADIDDSNLAPEVGNEERAISYRKGCYIGQEVISRLHSGGHVNKRLCGLKLRPLPGSLPQKGERLLKDGQEAGYITSAVVSPRFREVIGLGYVRREWCQPGTVLALASSGEAEVVALPFDGAR